MATIYGSEIGIGMTDLIGALLPAQFVGIPFSLLFGRFSGRLGTKRAILLGLGWSTLISLGGYFMCEAWHLWALALMGAMVQGGTQALSRSLFGPMVPKARSGECLGFYDITSKVAGIVGPALFAFVGQLTAPAVTASLLSSSSSWGVSSYSSARTRRRECAWQTRRVERWSWYRATARPTQTWQCAPRRCG